VRALLPPLILLGTAWLAYAAINRAWTRQIDRTHAAMPDATLDERAEAAVAEGHTGKKLLGVFATLAIAATGAIWLFIVLVRMAA
jgi:hypothetical protein